MKSLANILSEENQHLITLILEEKPQSVYELETLTGYMRKANNILRTLRKMEQYRLVQLIKSEQPGRGRAALIPKVLYDELDIQISLDLASKKRVIHSQ